MNKPNTKAIRDYVTKPERYWEEPTVYNAVQVAVLNRHIVNLCDYIDSLPDDFTEFDPKAALKRLDVIEQAEDRVRAEIREFVLNKTTKYEASFSPKTYIKLVDVNQILDFIDNGPKKPSAEETARLALHDWSQSESLKDSGPKSDYIVNALREAGLLKED